MGSLIPLALSIAPELSKWLLGATAEKATASVAQAIQSVTGTANTDAALAALQRDPAASNSLRVQLAQIAANMEAEAHDTDLNRLADVMRDTADARAQTIALSGQKSLVMWSAPIISAIVLLSFTATMVVVMVYGTPPGSETSANMLLGTLAAMATSVVSYWVGSSAGSARKDDRLAQQGK